MLLLFAIRVAEGPHVWGRVVHSVFIAHVFRERLPNFVSVLLFLLILRVGCGM